ncbi:taste receptor type 1 member 1-like [Thunnus albacares]|uniref:taste receptor type 1 member 1-like n=1 Tax=Thunnus albacares TaxID=8236 RepID=UPI001CF63754|nr:taste receptor type 1 member 1-like [Thunnus albacares]
MTSQVMHSQVHGNDHWGFAITSIALLIKRQRLIRVHINWQTETATMTHLVASLYLLGSFLHTFTQCIAQASEFQLEGDYLIGGLFDIHQASGPVYHDRPEGTDCSSKPFIMSSYLRFQLMRFTVEEINNSTSLLPNVSLGYEIFDHCSGTQSFPGIFKLISVNGLTQHWGEPQKNLSTVSKVIAVVGPFSSTDTLTVAPFFMVDLIPMVSYGAASSALSEKLKFPSFLRTVHSNKDIIAVIVNIILHFNWRWVAFLNSDDDFGKDGLELFIKRIKDTEICLAYTKELNHNTNYSIMFKQMEALRVHIMVVFAPKMTSEALIESAIELNITNKVWIAGDTWSLNKRLPKEKGIQNIGTVLGVSQPVVTIPGFSDFIFSSKSQTPCENAEQQMFCNQVCNCSGLSSKDVSAMDPSFSFPVYSAVYAIAHALHNVLQCGAGRCDDNITVYPHMVLAELKKSNFTLLNRSIQFNENGDPKYGSYSIVYWNQSGEAEEIGFHKFYEGVLFFINNTKIRWYKNKVPTSLCSPECHVGHVKRQNGIHKCCFTCEICPNGTYINSTEDPYKCIDCKETEWSTEGSTSCSLRLVEYIPFTDSGAILTMIGACTLVGLALATSVLFAINYNTPVVRSAGGPMCFLILGSLSLCSFSIFFYFGKPTIPFCILRFLPFSLFYAVCLACFVVRSFQIVCIFKIAAKFPKLYSWWMKYHGQWLVITVAFVTQALILLVGYFYGHPKPNNETIWYPDKIILGCEINLKCSSGPVILLVFLSSLCFIFSYMGKDLPKNYNEAKAITFCLLLLILTWIMFATECMIYRGKYIQTSNALAVLSSLYSFLLWYFLPKCYVIIFQPHKNTQQYFQGLIQSYTKTISQ